MTAVAVPQTTALPFFMADEQTFEERMEDRGGIRSVTVDGTTVTADSIDDEIKLDRYRREVDRGSVSPFSALHRAKIIPPGAGE